MFSPLFSLFPPSRNRSLYTWTWWRLGRCVFTVNLKCLSCFILHRIFYINLFNFDTFYSIYLVYLRVLFCSPDRCSWRRSLVTSKRRAYGDLEPIKELSTCLTLCFVVAWKGLWVFSFRGYFTPPLTLFGWDWTTIRGRSQGLFLCWGWTA